MRIRIILKKMHMDQQKAVAQDKGAAAFSRSTENKGLSGKAMFPTISQHPHGLSGAFYNLLPETHYFRRRWAEHPPAFVIRTEGQKPLTQWWEAAS